MSLVDKSLVVYEEQAGEGRYRMLQTLREYALEKLKASGEDEALRARHCDYFMRLTEEARDRWNGPEQKVWLQRLESEHDNLRTALAWCQQDPDRAETGLLLAGRLGPFWNTRCYFSEGRQHLAGALEQEGAAKPTSERAMALNGAGNLAFSQGDYAAAHRLHEEALEIRQQIGDQRSIAASLGNLGNVAYARGDYAAAQPYYEQALVLSREMGNHVWEANTIGNLGSIASGLGDFHKSRALHEQALAINREIGNRVWEAINLGNLGHVAIELKDLEAARSYYAQALAINREMGHRAYEADNLDGLGGLAQVEGNYAAAHRLHAEALAIWQSLEARRGIIQSLEMLADLFLAMQQLEKAARMYGAVLAQRDSIQAPPSPEIQPVYDRNLTDLRARLGLERFATAFCGGRAMSPEQAISYALEAS